MEYLLSLTRPRHHLREAVQRDILGEKSLQNAGEKINAGACELFLVQLDFHSRAAREADSVFRDHARKMALALNAQDARNLFFKKRWIAAP